MALWGSSLVCFVSVLAEVAFSDQALDLVFQGDTFLCYVLEHAVVITPFAGIDVFAERLLV